MFVECDASASHSTDGIRIVRLSVEDAVRPPRRGAGDDDSDEPATMAPVLDDVADAAELEAEPEKRRDLTMVRRIAIVAWVASVSYTHLRAHET